jgi:hypothetical protein
MPFCPSCGAEANEKAVVCIKCGVALPGVKSTLGSGEEVSDKQWLVTLLLAFFLGVLGVHRFYTGHTGIGVAQLLTLGGCGIWSFIDFILIIVGLYKDAKGRPLKK